MARPDPFASKEQKKRLTRQEALGRIKSPLLRKLGEDVIEVGDDYVQGGLIGEGGVLQSAMQQGPFAAGAALAQQVPDLDEVLYGQGGGELDFGNVVGGPATGAVQDPRQRADQMVGRHTANVRADPGQFGLTRIVKNPDGSYTNMAQHEQAGGQTRYYDEYGNRALGLARGQAPRTQGMDVSQTFAAEDAAGANLENDDYAMLRAARQGLNSRGVEDRAQRLLAERAAAAEMAALDPADRARLMVEQMQQGGANTRAAAANALTLRGQDLTHTAAMTGAQLNALEELNKQGNIDFERFKADPMGAVQAAMGELENLSKSEKAKALSDPNDKKGARVRRLIRQGLQQQTGNRNIDPAAITRPGLGRRIIDNFLPGPDAEFVDNAGMFGGNAIDAGLAGFNDEEMEAIIEAAMRERINNPR